MIEDILLVYGVCLILWAVLVVLDIILPGTEKPPTSKEVLKSALNTLFLSVIVGGSGVSYFFLMVR